MPSGSGSCPWAGQAISDQGRNRGLPRDEEQRDQVKTCRRIKQEPKQSAGTDDLLLTITAATPKPVQVRFDRAPSEAELRHAIDAQIPADGYFDDVHGSPAYRRRLTYFFAEQIRAELAKPGAAR